MLFLRNLFEFKRKKQIANFFFPCDFCQCNNLAMIVKHISDIFGLIDAVHSLKFQLCICKGNVLSKRKYKKSV